MSLTKLIKQREICAAFDSLAMAERTPPYLRGSKLLIPDSGGPQGLVGTAFGHIAYAQIARDLCPAKITLHWDMSTIEHVEQHLERTNLTNGQEEKLRHALAAARNEITEYAAGRGDIRRLATQVQVLAHVEMTYRGGLSPDPEFTPKNPMSDELMRLTELFNPLSRYAPNELCLLNPLFVNAVAIGGADGDLVIDGTLIDFKTNKDAVVQVGMLRQLAGYAALQVIGGIRLKKEIYRAPFEFVELYFARFGKSARWSISELFPRDNFSRFCAVIRTIIEPRQKKFDALMEPINRMALAALPIKKRSSGKPKKPIQK